MEPNKPHPIINIIMESIWIFDHNYSMSGLKWFYRCHRDTCRHLSANFQQNRKDNKTAYICQCPSGGPIISKLNCTWPIMNHKSQKDSDNTRRYHHWLFNRDPHDPFKLKVYWINLNELARSFRLIQLTCSLHVFSSKQQPLFRWKHRLFLVWGLHVLLRHAMKKSDSSINEYLVIADSN